MIFDYNGLGTKATPKQNALQFCQRTHEAMRCESARRHAGEYGFKVFSDLK
jgi:hypothetical protein